LIVVSETSKLGELPEPIQLTAHVAPVVDDEVGAHISNRAIFTVLLNGVKTEFATVQTPPHAPNRDVGVRGTFTRAELAIKRNRWVFTTFVRSCGITRPEDLEFLCVAFLGREMTCAALNGFAFLV